MKKLMIIITISVFLLPLHVLKAQENDQEMKTIFGNKNHDNGGYGALMFGYTQIDGRDAFLAGIKGGWLIDHHFTLGFAGFGFINDLEETKPGQDFKTYLGGGYGGLLLEPIIFPKFPVHVAFPIILGAGGISYFEDYCQDSYCSNPPEYSNGNIDSDAFFVVEPGLEIELNIISVFRIALGGSYRYTSNIILIDHDEDILRNFNGYITLKFGNF